MDEKDNDNIISLVPRTPAGMDAEEVKHVLSSWADLAEEVNLTNIALVGMSEDGSSFFGNAGKDGIGMIGLIELLKDNLIQQHFADGISEFDDE